MRRFVRTVIPVLVATSILLSTAKAKDSLAILSFLYDLENGINIKSWSHATKDKPLLVAMDPVYLG